MIVALGVRNVWSVILPYVHVHEIVTVMRISKRVYKILEEIAPSSRYWGLYNAVWVLQNLKYPPPRLPEFVRALHACSFCDNVVRYGRRLPYYDPFTYGRAGTRALICRNCYFLTNNSGQYNGCGVCKTHKPKYFLRRTPHHAFDYWFVCGDGSCGEISAGCAAVPGGWGDDAPPSAELIGRSPEHELYMCLQRLR